MAFVWETHGIHVGTSADRLAFRPGIAEPRAQARELRPDRVEHGIDDLDAVVERAVGLGFPSITFVIHTPRLTRFRYASERATDVKFIRGEAAYAGYRSRMEQLCARHAGRIAIRWGVELEWLGSGLGLEWSRAKLFQAAGADFVIGSLHFAPDGTPYDGTAAETEALVERRGGLEAFWEAYFGEVMTMVDASWQLIGVVGHLDVPRVFASAPRCYDDLEAADDPVARRLLALLEMIAGRGLALDLNLGGIRRATGPSPALPVLRAARRLGIPIAIGTDAHDPECLGKQYAEGLRIAGEAGYRYYVSFSRGIPEKRPLEPADGLTEDLPGRPSPYRSGLVGAGFRLLNLAIGLLNSRLAPAWRNELPRLSFGGGFAVLAEVFPEASSLGSFHAIRAWKAERSVTVSDQAPPATDPDLDYLFSHHLDEPGTLAVLFTTLASEEINVETAWLNPLGDGTATAWLTFDDPAGRVEEAIAFVRGTAPERFLEIEQRRRAAPPPLRPSAAYLLEIDGASLPMPLSRQMIVTVHDNRPGVLLVLLSALASGGVNVVDLQLGARGERGFAALGVEGDTRRVAEVLPLLGPRYAEASHVLLPDLPS